MTDKEINKIIDECYKKGYRQGIENVLSGCKIGNDIATILFDNGKLLEMKEPERDAIRNNRTIFLMNYLEGYSDMKVVMSGNIIKNEEKINAFSKSLFHSIDIPKGCKNCEAQGTCYNQRSITTYEYTNTHIFCDNCGAQYRQTRN